MDLFAWVYPSPAPLGPFLSLRNWTHCLTRFGDSRESHWTPEGAGQLVGEEGAGAGSEAAFRTLCTGLFRPAQSLPSNTAPINILVWVFVTWGIFIGLPCNHNFSLWEYGQCVLCVSYFLPSQYVCEAGNIIPSLQTRKLRILRGQ